MAFLSKTNKVQKQKELRRNLRKLRNLVNCDSSNAVMILSDAINCISTTIQKIEEIKREIETMDNMQHVEDKPLSFEVKVEEQGMNQFRLNVTSANKEEKNYLAIIMEVLEEHGIRIINANMSCYLGFDMNAFIEAPTYMDSSILTEVIIQAIKNSGSD